MVGEEIIQDAVNKTAPEIAQAVSYPIDLWWLPIIGILIPIGILIFAIYSAKETQRRHNEAQINSQKLHNESQERIQRMHNGAQKESQRQFNESQKLSQEHFNQSQNKSQNFEFMKQLENFEKQLRDEKTRFANSNMDFVHCKSLANGILIILERLSFLKISGSIDDVFIQYFESRFNAGKIIS